MLNELLLLLHTSLYIDLKSKLDFGAMMVRASRSLFTIKVKSSQFRKMQPMEKRIMQMPMIKLELTSLRLRRTGGDDPSLIIHMKRNTFV